MNDERGTSDCLSVRDGGGTGGGSEDFGRDHMVFVGNTFRGGISRDQQNTERTRGGRGEDYRKLNVT